MLQLYVVLGFFILETVLVFIFLLPRLGPIKPLQRLVSRVLGGTTLRRILIACFVILAFLVIESFQEMSYRQREERSPDNKGSHHEIGHALMLKSTMFRAQRNFYLTFFTFALFCTMFRLRGIHAEFDALDAKLEAKKKD